MRKYQLLVILWVGVIAGLSVMLTLWVGERAIGVTALLSVLLVALVLLSRGFAAYEPHTSPAEYFGASSMMASSTTLQSLGSAWVMLGNVVVAGMILGQAFGGVAMWVVFTWSLAFVLMSRRVDRVRAALQTEDTLHTFLHRAYGSRRMRRVAASITVFVAFGVFSIELIAGIALLIAVLPSPEGSVIAPLLILLLVVAMCVAAIAGGLRAVITTDAMLWPMVITGIVALFLFAMTETAGQTQEQMVTKFIPAGLDGWGVLAFLIGVAALQVPLLLGDFGTWQRIKATKVSDKDSLVKHTFRQAGWQFALWFVPIVAGIAVLGLPSLYETQSGNLYPSSYPLIETVRHWITSSNVPVLLRVFVIVVFLVGMLAVMASTANSYLIVAMESWVRDLWPRAPDDLYPDDEAIGREAISNARLLCALIGLVACLPVVILVQFNISLVSLIVIVFSVQVALAPAAALALYQEDVAKRLSPWVVTSTLGGFAAAIIFGFYTSYGLTGWWRDYGSFLTAPVAIIVPITTISVGLFMKGQGWRGVGAFLAKLLWPWSKVGNNV